MNPVISYLVAYLDQSKEKNAHSHDTVWQKGKNPKLESGKVGVGPALLLIQWVTLGTSLPFIGLSFLFCEMVEGS